MHERVQDYKILKILWIFSTFVSMFLISLEYVFIHDIQSMTVYSGLRHHWDAKQQPIFYVNIVFILTILMYIYLQIRIKLDHSDTTHHFFDAITSFGYVGFYIFLAALLLSGIKPTVENAAIRLTLQISFVNFFLFRLCWKHDELRNRVLRILMCTHIRRDPIIDVFC